MVHTLLSSQEYRITEDSGLDLDQETGIVTRRVSLTYRGTLQQLFAEFPFGSNTHFNGSELEQQTPNRMFCAGPSGVRMVPGTAENPHWDCNVEWVGLHSYSTTTPGASSGIWRLSPNWSVREFRLPYETPSGYRIHAAATMVPTGTDEEQSPVTVYENVPSINVRGVVVSTIFPHPRMAEITTLRAIFPAVIGAAQIQENCINLSALGNNEVGYNWSKEMTGRPSSGGLPSEGAWRIGDISTERVIEPVNTSGAGYTIAQRIYVISFPAIWTPRRTTI